jgi:hypothetical protein
LDYSVLLENSITAVGTVIRFRDSAEGVEGSGNHEHQPPCYALEMTSSANFADINSGPSVGHNVTGYLLQRRWTVVLGKQLTGEVDGHRLAVNLRMQASSPAMRR